MQMLAVERKPTRNYHFLQYSLTKECLVLAHLFGLCLEVDLQPITTSPVLIIQRLLWHPGALPKDTTRELARLFSTLSL